MSARRSRSAPALLPFCRSADGGVLRMPWSRSKNATDRL
jgi:hypothetical protein